MGAFALAEPDLRGEVVPADGRRNAVEVAVVDLFDEVIDLIGVFGPVGGILGQEPAQWLIQYGLNRNNIDAVHTGDCWAATRQQALDALQHVPACVHCRPDTALGLLE
ncbi:DUF6233 domain-containing protein [Streptomyces eurythermus]|uniref:DUF6233 domain-containing protein n=1 Tax=Streptomyces eurythermus TaxID=42237 RepID=UPI0036F8B39A